MSQDAKKAALSERDQEIIAVGASVASGCLPCTKFHVRAASASGAGESEIRQAVRDATRVRREAAEIMAGAGGLPPEGPSGQAADPAPSLLGELVATSAAYALNCTTGLARHMKAARSLGATDDQILTAIKIACAIKDVAGQKAKSAAGEFFGATEEDLAACDCDGEESGEPDETGCDPRAQAGQGRGTCSCRTEEDP